MKTARQGYDIICFSTSDWKSPWGSRQQIMRRLAKRHRVLFVEYQASWIHPLRYPRLLKKWWRWMKGPVEIAPNLYLLSPVPGLPFGFYVRPINRMNQMLLSWQMKRALKRLGFIDPLFWIYTPLAADLLGKLGEKDIVYHCIEAYAEEIPISIRQKTVEAMEKEIVQNADFVLSMSQTHFQRLAAKNSDTHYFPSAVDEECFFNGVSSKPVPQRLQEILPPRLGVLGNLDASKIDIALLESLAEEKPEWSLVFIGPFVRGRSAFKKLLKKRNVHWLGAVPPSEVPQYLRGIDVGLIPYRINTFTRGICPLKLFEYLASGISVVGTPLPELQTFSSVVSLAAENIPFREAVERALQEEGVEKEKRRAVGRTHTWENRVEWIETLLEGRG